MFETTGVVDEALLKEAWWHMIRPADKWMFALFFPLDAALAGYVIYLELYHFLPWVGLLMFLNVAIMYWNIARSRKVMLGRMKEAYGVPETRVTTRFLEEGIQEDNLSSKGSATLPYETIARLAQTEHFLLLMTKSLQAVPVFKNPALDLDGLLAYLKSKPTRIQWKA